MYNLLIIRGLETYPISLTLRDLLLLRVTSLLGMMWLPQQGQQPGIFGDPRLLVVSVVGKGLGDHWSARHVTIQPVDGRK